MKRLEILVLSFLIVLPFSLYAFDFPERCESEHFTIYYQAGVDLLDVAYKINIDSSAWVYKGQDETIVAGSKPEDILAQGVNNLFDEVSDILDMHLYSYSGDIKICANKEELKKVFFKLFGRKLQAESFYYPDGNAIYISPVGLRPGILGHEMAHAIICHYFVVMPPMKVQEVLAGYVEYSINKKIKKQ